MLNKIKFKVMKKILLSVLVCVCLFSCEDTNNDSGMYTPIVTTIEHEGCEYLAVRITNKKGISFIHKQNCRFCCPECHEIDSIK